MSEPIMQFRGEYSWLSNFAPVNIHLNGTVYPSVEHAYLAQKNNDPEWHHICSSAGIPAGKLKKLSRLVELRPDWEEYKNHVMWSCLLTKFMQQPFRDLLIATEDRQIFEGNYWNDTYWGYCLKTNRGSNHLGNMIMGIRTWLIKQSATTNQ